MAQESPLPVGDRRARRRQESIETILDLAVAEMTRHGVGALTMAAVARELGVSAPSMYKYFDSLLALYDALFRRGQQQNLAVLRHAQEGNAPGLEALGAALDATGRWAIDNPALAELLFWRPVPGYRPSDDAFAPTIELVDLLRGMLSDAIAAGQLGPDGASDEAMDLLAILHFGAISQQLANDPGTTWEDGRYARAHPRLLPLFVMAYPPEAVRG